MKKSIDIIVYGDGSCKNEKNKHTDMGCGFVAYKRNYVIEAQAIHPGKGTSNLSEWEALISSVRFIVPYILERHPNDRVKLQYFADSQIIVRMVTGEYSHRNFTPEYNRVMFWLDQLKPNHRFSATWIPRAENEVADRLSKLGNPYFKGKVK